MLPITYMYFFLCLFSFSSSPLLPQRQLALQLFLALGELLHFRLHELLFVLELFLFFCVLPLEAVKFVVELFFRFFEFRLFFFDSLDEHLPHFVGLALHLLQVLVPLLLMGREVGQSWQKNY